MAFTGDNINVRKFTDGVLHLAQQKGSRLRDKVHQKPAMGEITYFNRMDQVAAKKRLGRNSAVIPEDTPFDRRAVKHEMWYVADYIDRRDDINRQMDIKGDLTMAFGYGLGRQIDKTILDAAVGNAINVSSTLGESNVPLGSAQTVDEDFGTSNSLLTVEKCREAKRLLNKAAGGSDEKHYLCVTADDVDAMLTETEVTSADYNNVKALVHAEVNTFCGFEFILLHEDIIPDSSEGFKQLVAFSSRGIGLAMAEDINVQVDRIAEKHGDTLVQADMNLGAVRTEESKVVVIESYRS